MIEPFRTQFAFSIDIDVSIRELKATKQRLDKIISYFISRKRENVVEMVDWLKEQGHIDIVLQNL